MCDSACYLKPADCDLIRLYNNLTISYYFRNIPGLELIIVVVCNK